MSEGDIQIESNPARSRRRGGGTAGALVLSSVAQAGPAGLLAGNLIDVPVVNAKVASFSPSTLLSPELAQVASRRASVKQENGTAPALF